MRDKNEVLLKIVKNNYGSVFNLPYNHKFYSLGEYATHYVQYVLMSEKSKHFFGYTDSREILGLL